MHIYPPRKNPHNPPLTPPPSSANEKKNNLPPNSETLFKILQPAAPLSTLLKSFLAGKIQMVQKYVNDKN